MLSLNQCVDQAVYHELSMLIHGPMSESLTWPKTLANFCWPVDTLERVFKRAIITIVRLSYAWNGIIRPCIRFKSGTEKTLIVIPSSVSAFHRRAFKLTSSN